MAATVGVPFAVSVLDLPDAGYVWRVERAAAALELVEDAAGAPRDPPLAGAPAGRRLVLVAHAAGLHVLVLALGRPWEPAPVERRTVEVSAA